MLVRELRCRCDADDEEIERLLDDLRVAHGQTREDRAHTRRLPAVRRHQHVVGAPLDRAEQREAATADTRPSLRPVAAVTDAIAYQRHVGVQQAGTDELAVVAQLDVPELRPFVEVSSRALTRPCDRFRHSIGLTHGALERLAD